MNLANDLSAISASTQSFLQCPQGFVIGGEQVEGAGGSTLAVLDPSSSEEIAQVPAGNAADVDRAVGAAVTAMGDSRWANMRASERERLMHNLADLVEQNATQIAELEALESGRKVSDTRAFDAEFPAHVLRYMAGWPTKISGHTLPVSAPYMPPEMRFACQTLREPVGVVAAITPWNVPLGIAAWKVAPAVAAGCAVVLKPAEQTPLTALLFAQLALEAGFPPGVINVVTGTGMGVGEPLVNHAGVDKISFTGSTQTGRIIGAQAGGALKPVTLELGGKSPVVIMADADLDAAIPAAAWAIFGNQGQNCCAGSRLYVQREVYDRVIEGVVEIANSIRLGPSLAADVDMCPLISAEQKSRVSSLVKSGVADGAELLTGGGSPDHPGFYYSPTVLSDVRQDMRVVREEIFGPVLVARPFADLADAIQLANDSEFGLGASIFTRDVNNVQAFQQHVNAGSVWINVHNILDVGVPFGGFKSSGIGQDLGHESVLAHTRLKASYLSVPEFVQELAG